MKAKPIIIAGGVAVVAIVAYHYIFHKKTA